jgi:hypothetical protein
MHKAIVSRAYFQLSTSALVLSEHIAVCEARISVIQALEWCKRGKREGGVSQGQTPLGLLSLLHILIIEKLHRIGGNLCNFTLKSGLEQ